MKKMYPLVIAFLLVFPSLLSGKDICNSYVAENIQKDSIDGVYIPKDIKDCFLQLDKLLSEEDRSTIRNLENAEETIQFHHSLGMWIRNNWGLWGGSRLSKYLLSNGLKEPDEMSATILELYYHWLNGNDEAWRKWEKKPKDTPPPPPLNNSGEQNTTN